MGDLGNDRESTLADGLFRFGLFAWIHANARLFLRAFPRFPHREGLRRPALPGATPNRLVTKEGIAASRVGRHLRGGGEPDAIRLPFTQGPE